MALKSAEEIMGIKEMSTLEGKKKNSNSPRFQVKLRKQSPKKGVLLGQAQQKCPAGINLLIQSHEGTT